MAAAPSTTAAQRSSKPVSISRDAEGEAPKAFMMSRDRFRNAMSISPGSPAIFKAASASPKAASTF